MNTIENITPTPEDIENLKYKYQPGLTPKLDELDTDFNQEIINEIVLWKVNRYAAVDNETMDLINQIGTNDTELKTELTRAILTRLLRKEQKGFQLPMASTVLRFRNPKIYQILDQRVYRFLNLGEFKSSATKIDEQINMYLEYLVVLKNACLKHSVKFELADRVFYSMDKEYNKNEKLKGF